MAERQGYSDYQRTVNWDGPVVLSQSGGHNKSFITPMINCARFAYLAGSLTAGIGTAYNVILEWFMTNTSIEPVGVRRLVIDPEITEPGQIHLPHLGPWLQMTFSAKPLATYEPRATLFNSNRVYPLDFIPRRPVVVELARNFLAAEEVTQFPNSYFTGPMKVGITNSVVGTNVRVTMELETEPGVFKTIDTVVVTAAIGSATLYAPPGAWRVKISTTAASNVTVLIMPFLSGSS